MRKHGSVIAAIFAAACLFMVGCKKEQVIKIATQSPLTGDTKDTGIDIKNGTLLAIEQLSAPLAELGIKVELAPFDDEANADKGVANAKTIVADPAILAVVGHYDSGVQIPSSEVYHGANLCNISPANTNPNVTDRGYAEVNRICGRDDVQGTVGAQLAKKRRIRSAFVVHDTTPWGLGIAEYFRKEAEIQGIQIVGFLGTEERSNFITMIPGILKQKPDAIYLAAGYEASALFKQIRQKGFKGMFISVDGFDSPEAAKIVGDALVAGEGTYFSTVAGPAFAYPDTAKFVNDFKIRFGAPPKPYAAQSYDCAAIALKAIENAAKAADGKLPSRAEVSKAVRDLKEFPGITGTVTFNAKGDPTKAKYFVIQVTSADPSRWASNRVDQILDIAPPQ
jgi:branched-chain amino acid transport system substrate-binding protein